MNKTERLLYQKHNLSDEERNQCLRMLNCGITTQEIADIMHISKSTVSYIRQAHTACLAEDWSLLQKLHATGHRPMVEWALKITNSEVKYKEYFSLVPATAEPEQSAPSTDASVSNEDILSVLKDIRMVLVEIREMLK